MKQSKSEFANFSIQSLMGEVKTVIMEKQHSEKIDKLETEAFFSPSKKPFLPKSIQLVFQSSICSQVPCSQSRTCSLSREKIKVDIDMD